MSIDQLHMIKLLAAIGECHRMMSQHALCIGELAEVQNVVHDISMPYIPDGYQIEEFVDAELVSGEAVSWCIIVTITERCIVVESDVRRIHSVGQDVISTVANDTFSQNEDLSLLLPGIMNRLCSVRIS